MLKIEKQIQSAKASIAKAENRVATSTPEKVDQAKASLTKAKRRLRELQAKRRVQRAAGPKAKATKGQAGLKLAGVKASITRLENAKARAETRSEKIAIGKRVRARQAELADLEAA